LNILPEIKKIKELNLPFVAFRKPNEKQLTLIRQNTSDLFVFDDFSAKGYVFAPFDSSKEAYILQADAVYSEHIDFDDFDDNNLEVVSNKDDERLHVKKVTKAIATIQQTEMSKIVISRKEKVESSKLDVFLVFKKLLNKYSNAYTYMWFHPKVGMWIGATPETLLNVKGANFTTMSLAGTQYFKGNLNPCWGTKEIQEQQMVSDYIREFLQNNVSKLRFSDVETVKAGNLLHLKTTITGVLKSTNDMQRLVEYLHPTPAVCGLPKEKAKNYILKNEGYDRSFYTGYLGTLNLFDTTDLYVNIRCFSITNKEVYLYVGGGITEFSSPDKEWLETVVKSETIKSVF